MNSSLPSFNNFHSSFRRVRTALIYAKSFVQEVRNKSTYVDCYKNNRKGIIELNNGTKIEVQGKRCIQFLNAIFFNKIYGIPIHQIVIVDIGANKGLFSVFFGSQLKGKEFKIYAYEPHPNTFELLKRNIQLNHLEGNIHSFQKCVSGASVASQTFFVAKDSFDYSMYNEYSTDKEIAVDNITLKEIFNQNNLETVDLLKMNCEGAEYEILMKTPIPYLNRIKEIRMEYHNFELDGKIFGVAPLVEFLHNNSFTITNRLSYTSEHGIIWFKNQSKTLPKF